jgi:hypothetical protein
MAVTKDGGLFVDVANPTWKVVEMLDYVRRLVLWAGRASPCLSRFLAKVICHSDFPSQLVYAI